VILVAGSANLDFVIRVPHIPARGETVLGTSLDMVPGGKGANQAVACARAGGAVTEIVLASGDDEFAEPILQSLATAGVTVRQVKVKDQRTGLAFICLTDDAENAIVVAQGANNALTAEDLPVMRDYSHLLLQLETPMSVVTAYARAAKDQGVAVVLNAAPAQQLPAELLALLDILIVNEGELNVVAGSRGSIVDRLKRIDVPCAIVTLAARGCCARVAGKFSVQTGFAVQADDTTAAGDTFCGVLVARLSTDSDLSKALPYACAAGSLACTRDGAQASIPSCSEVQRLIDTTPVVAAECAELEEFCGLVH
jgi:ribokinase